MTYATRKEAADYLEQNGFVHLKGGRWENSQTQRIATIGPKTKTGCRIFYGKMAAA